MTKVASLAIVGTALLALSACGGADSDNASDQAGGSDAGAGVGEVSLADLQGTTYEAATSDALAAPRQSLVEGSTITIGFEKTGLSASAGCNGMGGEAVITDGRLELTDGLVGTEMACEDPVMAQERWLTKFLGSSPEVALEGDSLTLTTDDATLTLSATEGAEAPEDPDAPDDGVTSMN